MAHPHRDGLGQPLEQRMPRDVLVEGGVAVLLLLGGRDPASEVVGDELHAVADAQDGGLALEDVRRQLRRVGVVDAGGAAR